MKANINDGIYDVVRKRKLREGEKVVAVATTKSGVKYNLMHSGKNKIMMKQ